MPLLEGLKGGDKMSKSLGNSCRESPKILTKYTASWMSVSDELMGVTLSFCRSRPLPPVREWKRMSRMAQPARD
jgi:tyrosyl-tRNA synthetase